ncbi:MAG: GrpB family protein, partial [Clostridia bacterium]|nr:GrpB family protein [Clostridia bacterium]
MNKKLSEMTLEELWELFPIILTEHNPCWADWYGKEVELLKSTLPNGIEYYHVGSTAINGIMAKPIVDILIVVDSTVQMRQAADILQEHSYIVMSAGESRISLNKGYTESGFAERVFHLHIRLKDDTAVGDFRAYVIVNP